MQHTFGRRCYHCVHVNCKKQNSLPSKITIFKATLFNFSVDFIWFFFVQLCCIIKFKIYYQNVNRWNVTKICSSHGVVLTGGPRIGLRHDSRDFIDSCIWVCCHFFVNMKHGIFLGRSERSVGTSNKFIKIANLIICKILKKLFKGFI